MKLPIAWSKLQRKWLNVPTVFEVVSAHVCSIHKAIHYPEMNKYFQRNAIIDTFGGTGNSQESLIFLRFNLLKLAKYGIELQLFCRTVFCRMRIRKKNTLQRKKIFHFWTLYKKNFRNKKIFDSLKQSLWGLKQNYNNPCVVSAIIHWADLMTLQ